MSSKISVLGGWLRSGHPLKSCENVYVGHHSLDESAFKFRGSKNTVLIVCLANELPN